jgi:hypothetical protein
MKDQENNLSDSSIMQRGQKVFNLLGPEIQASAKKRLGVLE